MGFDRSIGDSESRHQVENPQRGHPTKFLALPDEVAFADACLCHDQEGRRNKCRNRNFSEVHDWCCWVFFLCNIKLAKRHQLSTKKWDLS